MAIDAFLKLGDIEGESQVKDYEDYIQVLAWSWGMSQSGTTHMGKGAGGGKANVHDLTITHNVDAATPRLMTACCSGEHFEDGGELILRKAGKEALIYLTYKFKPVIITSVSVGGSEGEEQITETFTVNFGKYEVSYQPQSATGAAEGGTKDGGWDIVSNCEV